MRWFSALCLIAILYVPLLGQNKILVVSSRPTNLGDTIKLNQVASEKDFILEYSDYLPFDLSTYSYSLIILGEYDGFDCSILKQYCISGGGLILTGSLPYDLLNGCIDAAEAVELLGFEYYTNGSGELRAAIDLEQISIPADSLLDRTPCEIGFGALSGQKEGAEVLAEWYCPGQQGQIAAVTRNQLQQGKIFYFSRLLSTIRIRQLLSWALEDGIQYRWGDADNSGRINLTDAVYIVRIVFGGGPMPARLNAGDANGDGSINISDAVYLVNYIFVGGSSPVAGRAE